MKKDPVATLKAENEALKQQLQEAKEQNRYLFEANRTLSKQVGNYKLELAKQPNITELEYKAKYKGELEAVSNINAFLKKNNIPQVSYRHGTVLFSENKDKGLSM
jgi:hypothetical protein